MDDDREMRPVEGEVDLDLIGQPQLDIPPTPIAEDEEEDAPVAGDPDEEMQ